MQQTSARTGEFKISDYLQAFIKLDSASGIVLVIAAAFAMVMINSRLQWLYDALLATPVQVAVAPTTTHGPADGGMMTCARTRPGFVNAIAPAAALPSNAGRSARALEAVCGLDDAGAFENFVLRAMAAARRRSLRFIRPPPPAARAQRSISPRRAPGF